MLLRRRRRQQYSLARCNNDTRAHRVKSPCIVSSLSRLRVAGVWPTTTNRTERLLISTILYILWSAEIKRRIKSDQWTGASCWLMIRKRVLWPFYWLPVLTPVIKFKKKTIKAVMQLCNMCDINRTKQTIHECIGAVSSEYHVKTVSCIFIYLLLIKIDVKRNWSTIFSVYPIFQQWTISLLWLISFVECFSQMNIEIWRKNNR